MCKRNLDTYKRGATLLLRDSLSVPSTSAQPIESEVDHETHICITSHKDTVREKVGSTIFEFPAGSFFQNNNSVLEPLTTYVRDAIFVPTESTTGFTCKPTHLVDTYCGSGLFSLTLSPYFEHIVGIEIDANSIRFANHNLSLNSLPTSKHAFHAGKSEDIFSTVLQNSASTTPFPPESTVVIIDPPRKGCDSNFLDQLISFRPSTLVYVSCNVHTQARDVGILVTKTEGDGQGRRYKVESLRGFDLFPQTSHVEGVAVLRLV
jgi:tRNA (uracil-5-)-methyltransferase